MTCSKCGEQYKPDGIPKRRCCLEEMELLTLAKLDAVIKQLDAIHAEDARIHSRKVE